MQMEQLLLALLLMLARAAPYSASTDQPVHGTVDEINYIIVVDRDVFEFSTCCPKCDSQTFTPLLTLKVI